MTHYDFFPNELGQLEMPSILTESPELSSVYDPSNEGSKVPESDEFLPETVSNAIRLGDPSAEGLLYARYHKQLVLILGGRGVPVDKRDDIAHEAYIVTLQRLRDGELEQPELVGRFLKRTAINIWLNEIRKSIRHGDAPLDSTDDDTISTAEDGQNHAESVELGDVVRAIVAELSQERDRLVLLLSYVYDWDKKSVCDYIDIEGRVYDNIRSRALKRCREVIARNPRLRLAAADLSEVSNA
ncbi:MAG: sigma-70 family RNA polymerase sigma factor [Pseudomonadota bacterium]